MAGVLLIVAGLFFKSTVYNGALTPNEAMPFYNHLFGSLHTLPLLNRIITIAFLLIIGYLLIRIGVRYLLLSFRSFMPAAFFLFFTVAHPITQQISPPLVGSLFYLACFAILFDVSDKRPDTFSVFTAGMVLALGSMFYLKLVWFLPLVWISLATLRTPTWRELFYPVIAFILTGIFLFTWYWTVLDNAPGFVELIGKNLAFSGSLDRYHFSVYIYYGFFFFIVILASIYIGNRFQTRKTVVQNIFQVLFYMFIAGILFFVFIDQFDPASLVFVAFPIAFIAANYFHRKRNPWTHEVILWILIGLIVFMQITT